MDMTRRPVRIPVPQIQHPTLQYFDLNVTSSLFPDAVNIFDAFEAMANDPTYGTMYAWVHFSLDGAQNAPAGGILINVSPFGPAARTSNFSFSIYQMMQDWDPTKLTWNTQPAVPQQPSWQSFWTTPGNLANTDTALQVFIPGNVCVWKGLLFVVNSDLQIRVDLS